jgi:AP2 domain.
MKEILLTQSKVALVDDEDHERLSCYPWCAYLFKGKIWRAIRTDNKIKATIYMHREVLNILDSSVLVDHISRNALDNRKSNLRIVTPSQSVMNRKGWAGRYKGVTKWYEKWRARIDVNHKQVFLGYFLTEEEAAYAYDKAAKELHGEFARLNFPEG